VSMESLISRVWLFIGFISFTAGLFTSIEEHGGTKCRKTNKG
jgi:hypothetical protein